MPKVTLLFAALHVLLMLALAVPIARHRHAHKVGLGDGGDKLLARKIRVHGNFTEYVPLEACGLAAAAVWGFGGVLLLGRLLHAAGLSGSGGYSKGRFWGTALTWLSLLLMALAGLWIGLR